MTRNLAPDGNGSVIRPDTSARHTQKNPQIYFFQFWFSHRDQALHKRNTTMKQKTYLANEQALKEHQRNPKRTTPKKLTMILPDTYQELLIQLSILKGTSKTNIVKAALDDLAEQYSSHLSL